MLLPSCAKGRHASLEDASLLSSNEWQGVAQNLHVVHAKGGDAANNRALHHVRGIQAPPKTHLQDGHIHLEWGAWSGADGGGKP